MILEGGVVVWIGDWNGIRDWEWGLMGMGVIILYKLRICSIECVKLIQ